MTSLIDLIKAERERRAGNADRIGIIHQGWHETRAELDARLAELRAAGKVGDKTMVVRWPGEKLQWVEPPYLHEMEAWRARQRRDE